MNQLGKNLFLALCLVATLLVILGLKRRFGGDGDAALLSQPSETAASAVPGTARNSPRPHVLQAKPVLQHESDIVSPISPQYADLENQSAGGSGSPIRPLQSPLAPSESVNATELIPVGVATGPSVIDNADAGTERATPAATRPVSESVLTRADDSFWSISEQVYGSGAYYRALFRHNEAKVLRPDQLRAGIEVKTPPLDVLRKLYPADFPAEPSSQPSN